MYVGGKTKDVGPRMLTEGTGNIIQAMKKLSAARRIAVVTSIGGRYSSSVLHVCMHDGGVRMYACMYVCIHLCMYVYIVLSDILYRQK